MIVENWGYGEVGVNVATVAPLESSRVHVPGAAPVGVLTRMLPALIVTGSISSVNSIVIECSVLIQVAPSSGVMASGP
jgi:hypothetical protein